MGLLTGTGFTLHIMSSMIPIFLMPIAVLDSIHILSEFFERYPQTQDRSTTLRLVYKELATPITFTSLTTAVAFASLAIARRYRRCRYSACSWLWECSSPGF